MKNKFRIVAVICAVFALTVAAFADGKWMTRSTAPIAAPGLVEAIVPPELHRATTDTNAPAGLDLSLLGPDGNFRAFELFMRSGGGQETLNLAAEKVTLLDDRRILWEAPIKSGYLINSLKVAINSGNYAGKVDIEAMLGGTWQILATGTALTPGDDSVEAAIHFPEAACEKVRCYFSGFDEYFKQTPVFVQSVTVTGRRAGSDYEYADLVPVVEQTTIDGGLEARIFLPGSGLRFESIEVFTSAQFKGTWQTGREKLVLGKRDFAAVEEGQASSIGEERQKLVINYPRIWENRVILLRMKSDEFFGKIEQVKVKVKLPRILFVADQAGEFSLQTGHIRPAGILEKPQSDKAGTAQILAFAAPEANPDWQAESILKTYSAKGGPFKADGYAWKASFTLEKPGFYQLVTNENISLDPYRDSMRIVRDGVQIPYFLGSVERRELDIAAETKYDQAGNRTVYILRLPEKLRKPAALRFKARGVFSRNLKFEKHEMGQISWQPWREVQWVNRTEDETEFNFGLVHFPEDQKEIRMTVEHGSNQALEINGFKGLYSAQDLFFIAGEPGVYSLMGGNSTALTPVYDLAMVEAALSELDPLKAQPGTPEIIASGSAATTADGSAPIDQGAPFNDGGYSWVATFPVAAPGFYQLALNLKAALDSNPDGIRLVKNGMQIPYFPGRLSESSIDLKFATEYSRDNNTSYITVQLPAASKQWRSLEFVSGGIFNRNLTLEIRKPGKLGWKSFKTSTWVNRHEGSSGHTISLDRLPDGETELRLVISHGDNSPIEVMSVKGIYQSQTMLFQANEAGEFKIYGGNASARAPKYDLALIKDNMLKKEPSMLQLGEPAEYSGASQVGKHIEEAFSDRGWGIYAVLGLVTALLLVIIVRLFPEEKKPIDK